jgi:hypothetical protein
LGILLAVGLGAASAWWVKGHESITEAATVHLPPEVPAFFRAGGKALAHFAGDPDRWKNRQATFSRDAVAPDHFLDREDLSGEPLPKTGRYAAIRLMQKLGKEPDRVGLLPYAILEGVDKLACAFYDFRQEPDNPAIPMKCLVYAGNLAHYTTDASMPLHTTIHFDGRVQPNGRGKLQRGIHAKLDAFPEKNGFTPEEICRGLVAQAYADPWQSTLDFLAESHKEIDTCYRLDAAGAFDTPTEESRSFVMARCRAGAQFTMNLWYTAWLQSAKLPPHY